MNKDQWLTILLDGSTPERDIKALLDMNYEMTRPKQRKNPHYAIRKGTNE